VNAAVHYVISAFGHFLTPKSITNSSYADIYACYYSLTLIPAGLSMAKGHLPGKLAVILHADIASSTALMRQDEQLAHERIQDCFHRFSDSVTKYHGHVCELRGDALLAEFERASDAVTAALAFQSEQQDYLAGIEDDIQPVVRIGIAMGEVVIADGTVTGAGVVLAQRVEQLASPGGLCITAAIHEALPARMPFSQIDLGDQVLKGFDDQVHVYRVELSPGESIPPPQRASRRQGRLPPPGLKWGALVFVLVVIVGITYWAPSVREEMQSIDHEAIQLPDRPSIAVLPFTNLSSDAEQGYFADGMTEDLITDLSKLSGLFVISRNTVFTYKGKVVNIRKVAEELGVRYVLEGSVRRSGNQVRINAQLIDATTDGHVWAERYDGIIEDIFALQDKVSSKIVSTLAIKLTRDEQDQITQRETDNTEAYDTFLRGWEQYLKQTPESFLRASELFKKATELDPNYYRAYAALSLTLWQGWRSFWFEKMGYKSTHDIRFAAEEYLAKAMQQPTPLALQISTAMHAQWGRNDEAIADGERAIAIDPNNADGYVALAHALNLVGDPQKALPLMEKAIRLNPHYPSSYLYELGMARFGIEDYDGAAVALQQAITINPDDRLSARLLIATLGQLSRAADALDIIDRAGKNYRGHDPLTIRGIAFWYPFQKPEDAERLADGLRKAGIPD
jgi:TolB-like protein/class 3 adenylate cyclase